MHQRTEGHAGDAERDHRRAVVVDDGGDVGTRFVNAGVNEALGVGLAAARLDGLPFQRDLHDVSRLDALGGPGPGHEKTAGVGGMADADVAEGVYHPLPGQDSVGGDEFLQGGRQGGHVGRIIR